MTLLASAYIDGFDPSGPLIYAESPFWTVLALSVGGVALIVIFIVSENRGGQKRSPASKVFLSLVAMMVAACPVLVSTEAPPYSVGKEAARWAHDRYGVDMADYDVKSLINGFSSGSSTSTVMLDDGQKITGRKISGKIILVKRGSGNPNSEMDVVYEGAK